MFDTVSHFRPSVILVGKARSLTVEGLVAVKQDNGTSSFVHDTVPLKGRLLALPANKRHGWKGLSGTHTLVYFARS